MPGPRGPSAAAMSDANSWWRSKCPLHQPMNSHISWGAVTFVPVLTGRHSSTVGVPVRHHNTALDTARSKYQASKPAQMWD